jgi:hypothetical protein
MEEIWKDVYYDGIKTNREVSNLGRVRVGDKYLLPADNGAGYLTYAVAQRVRNGKSVTVREYIHRIVAGAFLPNPNNYPQVNHIDCNKSNNCVDNLEWISGSSNIKHAHKEGRMEARNKTGPVVVLSEEEVVDCYTRIKAGEGVSAVARSMGKSRTTTSSIVNKRSRRDITDKLDAEIH